MFNLDVYRDLGLQQQNADEQVASCWMLLVMTKTTFNFLKFDIVDVL